MDRWVRSHLKSSMGYHGEMVIKSTFEYEHTPTVFCSKIKSPTLLGMVSNKMSIKTIFGHKHFLKH